jgi:hypothetical protein
MTKQMTANKLFIVVAFISFNNHPFVKDIQNAADILKQEKTTVLHIKNTSYTEGSEALSIVSPELIRWSAFQDFMETTANEVLYVQKGKEAANFSIGHFQMKPSFVEQLEEYVATHEALATFSYVVIKGKAEKECRRERIERLKQFAWQLRYAHVYWLVAKDKFKHRTFKSPKERIRFFATAYNYGFFRPEIEIETWQNKKAFPFGAQYKGEQVSYADLAIEFYEKYATQFDK